MSERMTESERATLCRRIDELCAEVEALKRDEWAAGFNAGCDAVEAAYEDGRPYYEVENAKLQDENARLRSCLSDDAENARMIMGENAKLRKLLRDFLHEHADYIAEGNYFIGDLDLEHAMHHNQAYFRREAKKLGIEVDS